MGDDVVNNLIIDLIDSKEFQRLRRIKQLGMADFAYPNATHTRFAHSIGVAYLAKRVIAQILALESKTQPCPKKTAFFAEIRRDAPLAVVAALLHDIGHGILSHVTEELTGIHHETWTKQIILGDTEINRLLTAYNPDAPIIVCNILTSHPAHSHSGRIIDSTIDVDKMDYLLRDSHMTGSGYGRFDLEWLLNMLTVGIYNGRVVIGLDEGKGTSVAEDFVMARIYMLKNVYLHKTSLVAQQMLKLLFTRLCQVGKCCYPSIGMGKVFAGNADLQDFLSVSDEHFYMLLSCLTNCGDEVLETLAGGLYHRKLYKEITKDKYNALPDAFKQYYAFEIKAHGAEEKLTYRLGKDEIFLFDKQGNAGELLTKSLITPPNMGNYDYHMGYFAKEDF